MCGFVGLLDPSAALGHDDLAALTEQMSEEVAARGPDDHGVWVDPAVGVGLGHRRLSIIDLSPAGHQPMVSADGRWVIAYNGEIYNHLDLVGQLTSAGVHLRGHSDTEVLLELIALRGLERTLEEIEGMFAFAVWDRQERRMFLARDRIGEKPLYYGRAGRAVVFGSGLDALARHPDFDAVVDPDAVSGLLRFKAVPTPLSIYRDARKLPPGHWVEVAGDGTVSEPRSFWSYRDVVVDGAARPFRGSEADAVDELDRLLRTSVARRLIADVPVGAFLSGGIDSSTVVAIMREVTDVPVETFTIGFPHAGFDESVDAEAVARHLGTNHHVMQVSGDDALAVVDELPDIYDEPFADSSQIPTVLVSRLARRHVTVVLSGDGGDELFGGYYRHWWLPGIDRKLRRVPVGVRRGAARVADLVPPRRWDDLGRYAPKRVRLRELGVKIDKAAAVAPLAGPAEMYVRSMSSWPDPTRVVRGGAEPDVLTMRPGDWPPLTDPTAQLMAIDLLAYLPDDILAKVDRATMSVGLEGRIPLLDRSIIEFAATLPMSLRAGDGEGKVVLRRLLERHVPRALTDRAKAGFVIPVDDWLRGALRPWAEDLLSGPGAGDWFDRRVLDATWREHQTLRRNHGYRLWNVLMFLSWLQRRPAARR